MDADGKVIVFDEEKCKAQGWDCSRCETSRLLFFRL
jgi:hypothetical protein